MVTFNFSYAPGTSVQQMIGFETAGRIWAAYLADNVTINLHVGVSNDLPSNIIGGALPGISASHAYMDIKTRLKADATSTDDQAAIANIEGRAGKKEDFKAAFDMFDSSGKNVGTSTITRNFNITRANAKSLGVTFTNGTTALDGMVVFGSLAGSTYSWSYDYTRSSTASSNSLDFLSTAIHEIGHILGMTSGIDKPGWLSSNVGGNKTLERAYKDFVASSATYTTPLDLFRYSNRTLGTDNNDLSFGSNGGAKYFAIDGKTVIAEFSTGRDGSLGGDGQQASHWKQGTSGIMDPTLAPGARESISALDQRAMDVIGWNLAPNAATLNLDLAALVGQAQQALAARLGQTVAWLNANATTAAQLLSQDRSQDIITMVQNSQVYDWGRTWYNPYRQVVDMLTQQQVYTTLQTTTSMCDCMVCHRSPIADFADAVLSDRSKNVGWLAVGTVFPLNANGLAGKGSQAVPEVATPEMIHAIHQVVQPIAQAGGEFWRDRPRDLGTRSTIGQDAELPGVPVLSPDSDLQPEQPLGNQGQPRYHASARRSSLVQGSHNAPPFELDLDLSL